MTYQGFFDMFISETPFTYLLIQVVYKFVFIVTSSESLFFLYIYISIYLSSLFINIYVLLCLSNIPKSNVFHFLLIWMNQTRKVRGDICVRGHICVLDISSLHLFLLVIDKLFRQRGLCCFNILYYLSISCSDSVVFVV